MNKYIKKMIEKGKVAILFGAGASKSSKDRFGGDLLSGEKLAELLAAEAEMSYSGEDLATVFGAVRGKLGNRIDSILEEKYKHCKPSEEYKQFARFPWARIYTLNIDDSLDKSLQSYSPQHVNIRSRTDKIVDQDQLYNKLEYIKLNGSIDRLENGLIFSTKDYGKASASSPLWYQELAEDYFKYTFLFIGTKLKESLFYHQVERYKVDTSSIEQRSYLLTPTATEIEKHSLLSGHNIEHISCKFNEFVDWLQSEFPKPLSPTQVAVNNNPALGIMLKLPRQKDRKDYAKIFEYVISVNRKDLLTFAKEKSLIGKIRNFYRGFKPTWNDIIDEVPASLEATEEFYNHLLEVLNGPDKLSVIYGPAGSGKSTLLKQIAFRIAEERRIPIYFIDQPVENLSKIIEELERITKDRFVIFCERLDVFVRDIVKILDSAAMEKGIIVGTESQNVWSSRTKAKLGKFCKDPYALSTINTNDAELILDKLERFGPWTRLSRLSRSKRIEELTTKAKRQLLIGLFETTSGLGFEKIIEKEYTNIPDDSSRILLILVGIATIHKISISDSYIKRALTYLGVEESIASISNKVKGIIYYEKGKLFARHPVYVRHLFDQMIDPQIFYDSITAILKSYTVFEAPVIQHVRRDEGILFKAIINHRFLKDIFRGDKEYIIPIYGSFEKYFENDGLFWLQYGLSLRDFQCHSDALEKLITAFNAYETPHTEHALAQQELIMGTRSESKEKAFSLLEKAKFRLEHLDKTLTSDDTYPIVTLSEGHTKIVIKFGTDKEARAVAKSYANILGKRIQENGSLRVKEAWARLTYFSTSGTWKNRGGSDLF